MSTSDNPNTSESGNTECNGPTEMELAQLLVKTLVPSFRKEIRLQALIAYQVDGESYRSLIVDRSFKRDSNEDPNNSKNEPKSPEMTATSPLNDSGIECGDTPAQNGGPSNQPVSRRKRRFCRPCKIPQSPQIEESTPPKIPELEPHLVLPTTLSDVNETITPALMNALTSAAQLEPKHQIPILPNISISTLNKIIISPISSTKAANSVTTSTPRPILPRPITGTITSTPITTTFQPLANLQDHSTDGAEPGENDDALASSRRYGKSFICNQCKLAFLSLNSLCEHTYSQHKSFRCNFCGAQFTQRSNLQRHSLRHVGFKPFVCGVCQKEYYRKDHLVRHIEVTHPGTDAKKNIIVKLSSAECLDYLDAITQQHSHSLPNGQVESIAKQEEASTSNGVTSSEAEVPIAIETASSNAA
nr:zinc finger protein [Hymenolepis microstoma]